MRQLRLTRIQVAAAGLAVVAGIIAVSLFMFMKPSWALTRKTNADAQALEQQVRTERPKAEQALQAAKAEEARVGKRYDGIMKKRMPDLSLQDRLAGMIRLQTFGDDELDLIGDWFDSTGAEVTGYSFPQVGTELPDPTRRMMPPLTWNLSVTVSDFPAFLKWLPKLTQAPRFMVLNNVNLRGMRQPGTPFTATVSVTLYEWLKRPRVAAAAAVAQAGAVQTGGQGPGGPGRGQRGGQRGGQGRGGQGRGGM